MRDWSPILGLPLWAWLFVVPTLFALLCYMARHRMRAFLTPVWRGLDALYLASGVLAACFMIMILLLIVAQMIARWSDTAFPGSTEFAGYAMACTSFFALAHALTRGAHIRVSLFLNLSPRLGRFLDPLAIFLSAITATYFARYAIKTNGFSAMLNDRTQGQDKVPESLVNLIAGNWDQLATDKWVYTPIWLPQLAMSAGTILLAICLWDLLCRTLVLGRNPAEAEAIE